MSAIEHASNTPAQKTSWDKEHPCLTQGEVQESAGAEVCVHVTVAVVSSFRVLPSLPGVGYVRKEQGGLGVTF